MQATFLLASFLLVGGGVLLLLATLAWRHRPAPSAKELTWLLLAAATWVLAAAGEHLAPGLDGKVTAAKIQYLGILNLPIASLATVLATIDIRHRLRKKVPVLVSLSGLAWLTVLTNDLHGLVWVDVSLRSLDRASILTIEHGPAFWVICVSSHLILVTAAITYFRSDRSEKLLIGAGFAAPWIANLIYISQVSPLDGYRPHAFCARGHRELFQLGFPRTRIGVLGREARDRRHPRLRQ